MRTKAVANRTASMLLGRSTRSITRVLLAAAILGGWLSTSAPAQTRVRAELVIDSGLQNPVFLASPPGDTRHLYISEQNVGRIRVLDLQTGRLSTFLDLPDFGALQAGLQSFAFHPDFSINNKFYVNWFRDDTRTIWIDEYERDQDNPLEVYYDAHRHILSLPNPTGSHNGGWLGFGPDGYLYITTGDGGAVGRPTDGLPAQDPFDLHGKVLRLDINRDQFPRHLAFNYGIPPTNPFADGSQGAPEVFAIGLRHPFRASFDRETGDMYIGDVGGSRREEIDFIPAGTNGGQNFGWRAREGTIDTPQYPDPAPPDAIDPIYDYPHGVSNAVIGGYVYRGEAITELGGTYFFTDVITNQIYSFRYDGQQLTHLVNRTPELARPGGGSYRSLVSFGEDSSGELYFIDRLAGDIFRIVEETTAMAGDFNRDGIIDRADLTLWQAGFGITSGASIRDGDYDVDGDVDGEDLMRFLMSIGQSTNSGGAQSVASIPEPSSLAVALLLLAGAPLTLAKRGAMRIRAESTRTRIRTR